MKAYLPGENAVGKRILVERLAPTRRGLGPMTAWEIVGVVADEKAGGLDEAQDVGVYASFAQDPVVVAGGTVPVLAGMVLGLAGAAGLTRFIRSMLFATSPLDGMTLAGVATLLLAVAAAACLAPAWRAARTDPISALRQE